jgi:hypothetical protein
MSKPSTSKMFYKFTVVQTQVRQGEVWLSPDDFLSFSKIEKWKGNELSETVELKTVNGDTHIIVGSLDSFLKIWSKFMEASGKAGE